MSSHLRHCPKHRKPQPCPHCAMIVAKPARIGPPLDEAPPDPFADRDAYHDELKAPLKFTDKAIKLQKEKEAERGRARRKLRREQLAAIKLRLKTPFREIKRLAEELKDALGSGASDMSKGKYMSDAPTSKGQIVYTQKIEQVGAAVNRAAALGAQTVDLETGEAFWPEHDRRHVVPEGTGERGGGQRSNDEQKISSGNRVDRHSGVPLAPAATTSFVVKLGTDLDHGQALQNLFHRLFIEVKEDAGYFICKLCHTNYPSELTCKQHVEDIHGDENEPKHDQRFGDVVTPEVRRVKRARIVRI
jgi:hypothetical protein